MSESVVIAAREGVAGTILMNRPRALNALDQGMIEALADALAAFRDDPAVALVILEGAGGRAFCAGGDVRAIRSAGMARDMDVIDAFFGAEYALNRAIAEYPKPWISLIDGVCMGGGIGVSVHGSHRVVTEHALLAMPETAIGFFPDVGTSFTLPRLPGAVGMWLGLTGARLQGAAAVEAGLATHACDRAALPGVRAALVAGDVAVLDAMPPPLAREIAPLRPAIDRCFGQDDVPAILHALAAEGTDWAAAQTAALLRMSPTALFVTHELLTRGAGLDLARCLAMERDLTRRIIPGPDFIEGVRAVLVDKDQAPRWSPAAIEDMDPDAIRALFAPAP